MSKKRFSKKESKEIVKALIERQLVKDGAEFKMIGGKLVIKQKNKPSENNSNKKPSIDGFIFNVLKESNLLKS